ncbi:Mu P family protein [Yersinia ruckeri]|uniref:Mu P family protein n=1 Tax=Yersinia ruckeri TaxID=29486 RepID=A0A380QTR9_YERRU|nr:Mu P family protein [Yersinia ruckeri]
MLGQDVVVTGYIDRWAPMISKTRHEVRATGRSNARIWSIAPLNGPIT